MVTFEELAHNRDFLISEEEAYELVSITGIRSWKYCLVELGRLYRWKNNRFCSLEETINYRFLEHPESEEVWREYLDYCRDPSNRRDNPERSPELFLQLRDTLLREGYDPKKGIIVIDQYHTVCVGLHRACILLSQFGKDFHVPVLKIRCKMSRAWFLPSIQYKITHRQNIFLCR